MTVTSVLLCLLIALSASSAAADEIHGCGGFVEASSHLIKSRKASDSKLDYSHITVELCTVDGLVKERTQCAPNGYYFIPVYDKGSFVVRVKGPKGWAWEPESVPVVVDQNGCNKNADINFQFTGFTVSGRVRGAVGGESCSLQHEGPAGVKVELLSTSNDPIASVLTSATGDYSFTDIFPGNYKLQASHPDFEIDLRGSSEVDLGFGNIVVDDVFFVRGYNIFGSVAAQGNPILGVHIFLYSNDEAEVHCPQGVGNAPREGALCHAVTDADGKFTFRSIPCGVYELLPYYKGENTVFDVSPPSQIVSVVHNHVTAPQRFQVTGFSVGGRVVDGDGAGVDNARVIVDGQLRAITDNLGYYKLDQVTSKHYFIVAEKEHYKFNTLENFLVLPNMAHIDDIKAIYYDLCGAVRMITSDSKAMVTLTHGPENVKPLKKLVDENGVFCFQVPAGEYRLSALAVDSENSPSLLFSPSYFDVKVNSPLLNVEFFQSQVSIHGSVLCKEKCSPNISLSLARLIGGVMGERTTIALRHESNEFMFTKVFPGKYRLEIRHIPSSAVSLADDWCWDRSVIDLDVGTDDVTGIVFVQKGYWIEIISTHDTDAYVRQPDSSKFDLSIKKGSQKICIEAPGKHELYFVNSCIFFGSSSLIFDTQNPMPVHISGKKYLVKGEIHLDFSFRRDEADLPDEIIVDTFKGDGSFLETISTRFASDESGQRGILVYEYSTWADLGDDHVFVPKDSSAKRKKILFYPTQRQFSVVVNGCQVTIPSILGRVGHYLEGSVSPELSGVNIRVLAAGQSIYAPLKEGDLAFETETEMDGSFSAGPLYDDISYKIEAAKPGYHLKQTGTTTFTCQKLGQIVVHIYGENEEFFPSVLLSLSGEDGYRNNSVSGAGGSFSFDNLFPGSFYLRPLLKEYSFSPPAVAIELVSGESRVVDFQATRVAYSAMGAVTLLSGQPKEGVFVEARSESKGYYEEAKTDNLGNFRLRGLLPDTKYTIRVVAKEEAGFAAIERASPEYVTITVGSEDIKGVDFVVFEQPEMTILSGHVEGTDLDILQKHLSVEIRLASDTSRVESVVPLPLSNYFQIRDLPKVRHLVQLRSGLPSNTHTFDAEIVEVDLERQPQVHVGPLKYRIEERHLKQELTPAPVFPLIVGVSVIAILISMPRLKDLYQMAVGLTPSGSATMSSKNQPREPRKPVLRKRA